MAAVSDDVSFEEESSMPTLISQSSNSQAILNPSKYPDSLQIMVECVNNSFLSRALSTAKEVPMRIVTLAFTTATVNNLNDTVSFEIQGGKRTTISKTNFTKLLCLPTQGPYVTPTSQELIDMFNSMGHQPYMKRVSDFKKSRLPAVWSLLFGFILRGLTSRTCGLDAGSKELYALMYGLYKGVKVDFATVVWSEFVDSIKHSKRATELSSHRFWALIVSQAYEFHKIPIDASEVPKMVVHQISIPVKVDQSHFSFIGQIPEEMLSLIKCQSKILDQYKASLIIPYPVRPTPQEGEDVQITRLTRMSAKKRKTPLGEPKIVEAMKKSKRVKKIVEELVVEEEEEQQHEGGLNFEEDIPITTTQTIVKTSLVETISETHISTSEIPVSTFEVQQSSEVTLPISVQDSLPIFPEVSRQITSEAQIFKGPLKNTLGNVSIDAEEEEERVDGFVFEASDDVVNDFEMAALGEGLVDSDEEDEEDDNQLMSRRDFKKVNRKLNVLLQSLDSKTQSSQHLNQEKMLADFSVILSDQNKKIDSLKTGFDLFKAHINIKTKSHMKKVQKVMSNECKNLLDEISKMREENEKSLHKAFGDLKSEDENSLKSINESLTEAKKREITLQDELTKVLAHIELLHSHTNVINPTELTKSISLPFSKPLSIGSSIVTLMPLSTSEPSSSKGKEKMEMLSKKELKQKRFEERNSSQVNFDAEYANEVAEEEKLEAENRVKLIRSLAFSENTVFDLVPKQSFSIINSLEKQLDFPISPRAYGYPIMGPMINENISDWLYNKTLVHFYALVGKPSQFSWSPKMIRRVESVIKTETFENVFQNFKFVVHRDITDNVAFTIADFPNLNPHDLIVLMKLLKDKGLKPKSGVMQCIKIFLSCYYRDIARTDIVLAGAINQKVKTPNIDAEGIDNIGVGEMVTKPTWGSTYLVKEENDRSRKVFFRMNEKERFPNKVLEGMIQRIMLNSRNSESVRKKGVDMLRWWLKIREVLLELVPVLFPELKKD